MIYRVLNTILLLVLFSGCATKHSLVDSFIASEVGEGVLYSLPKQLLKVEYKRTPIKAGPAKKALNAAQKALDSAKKSKDGKSKEITALKKFIANIDSGAAGYKQLLVKKQTELLGLNTELITLISVLAKKNENFDSATILFAQAQSGTSTVSEELKLTPSSVLPDPEMQFYAKLNHKGFFSDELELKVKGGLLDGAIGHSKGEVDSIVSAIVGGLSGLGTLSTFGTLSTSRAEDATPSPVGCKSTLFIKMTIDPDNQEEIDALNEALKPCIGLEINSPSSVSRTVTITGIGTIKGYADGDVTVNVDGDTTVTGPVTEEVTVTGDLRAKGLVEGATSHVRTQTPGLLYRQPGVYEVKVKGLPNDNLLRVERVTLAQGGQVGFVSFPKSGFAKIEYDIGFTKGALTKHKLTRPSEVLGIVSLLPNALKAIFAIPTELIQLKVDYSSTETSLIEQQKALIEANIALEAQQKLLNSAQ